MTCSEVLKALPGLALGDLDAEPARRVAEHLESCAECRAGRAELQAAVGALEGVAPLAPSTERRQSVTAAMAAAQAELAERALVRPRRSWLPAAAAGFFLALLLGSVLFLPRPSGPGFVVSEVNGRADLCRAATGDWAPVAVRDVLRPGDRLVTQAGTVVGLSAEGASLFVDQHTSIAFTRLGRLSLDRGRLYAELAGPAGSIVVSDTANNAVTLRRGRAEVAVRDVRGLVGGARQSREGSSVLPESRVDVAARLSVRVEEGEAVLAGSDDQRLRAAGGHEGTFDLGGRPSTAEAAAGEAAPWRKPGFYRHR